MGRLSGKVAVITGGTRGLGLAVAHAYAKEDAAVVVASRAQSSVDRAVADLRADGARAAGIVCDVGDVGQVQALAQHAVDSFGRLDIWVNNAGISAPYGPTLEVSPEQFLSVIQTNILGTYYGSLVAMQHFVAQGSGKLINILGRGDKQPTPNQNAYAGSKAWIRSFTLALAQEYKKTDVGVYAFNPGLVLTEFLSDLEVIAGHEEEVQPLKFVMRLWANPPEVPAQKAMWLASSATDGRTGLSVTSLTPARLLGGVLKEGWRIVRRQPAPKVTLNVRSVPVHKA
ncbi:SDR family NAD(P)-dependent oxidoreductase [bacterium]|nr:SDR family NAD(P)-dependent oxidoreductase [bacterium]